MAFTTKELLEQALREYFLQAQYDVFKPIDPPAAPVEESIKETGEQYILVHFALNEIHEAVKQETAFRARFMVNEQGQAQTKYIVTDDEKNEVRKYIKDGASRLFNALTENTKGVTGAFRVEENPTVITYSGQGEFTAGSLLVRDDKLYYCLKTTGISPSTDSPDWMLIADGESERVYLLLAMHPNWNRNTSQPLDTALRNALVNFALFRWYGIAGIPPLEQAKALEFELNINEIHSLTYRRIKPIINPVRGFL